MMIKITTKCSMGCPHCMNDSKPIDNHMSWSVLSDAVEFINKYNSFLLLVAGGEPTEHPEFMDMLEYICRNLRRDIITTVATNGIWLQDHRDFVDYIIKTYPLLEFQVTSVPGLYPKLIDKSKPIYSYKQYKDRVIVCEKIESMYPQGRALQNGYDWPRTKASKCINPRILEKQMRVKGGSYYKFSSILQEMSSHLLSCTPYIAPNGDVKLGESDLCPTCTTIYKSETEILEDIHNFKCDACKFINDARLPEHIKEMLYD